MVLQKKIGVTRYQHQHSNFEFSFFMFSSTISLEMADTAKEGLDISASHMTDETPSGRSQIQDFYSGATIFITGATGFLGKLVIEKLLRTCPDLKRIYILVRPKKDKEIASRVQEIFESQVESNKN